MKTMNLKWGKNENDDRRQQRRIRTGSRIQKKKISNFKNSIFQISIYVPRLCRPVSRAYMRTIYTNKLCCANERVTVFCA